MTGLEVFLEDSAREFVRKEVIDRIPSYLRRKEFLDNKQKYGKPASRNLLKPHEKEFLDDSVRGIVIDCKIRHPELRGDLIRKLANYYLYTPIEEDF